MLGRLHRERVSKIYSTSKNMTSKFNLFLHKNPIEIDSVLQLLSLTASRKIQESTAFSISLSLFSRSLLPPPPPLPPPLTFPLFFFYIMLIK